MLFHISPENSSINKKLELSVNNSSANKYIQSIPSIHCFTKTISLQNLQTNKYSQINTYNIPIDKKSLNSLNKKINFNKNSPNKNSNKTFSDKTSFVDINQFFGEKCPLTLDILKKKFKTLGSCKTSTKSMGLIKGYSVNTNQGIVRNYNEDRVTIIINMIKPINYKKPYWPKISFFGIYDGHGGKGCAEFLKDNLHKFIANDKNFPENISESIYSGFYKAEKEFLNNYAINKNTNNIIDKSGSCALIMLIIDSKTYIANVGDSRCLLSLNNGTKYIVVTEDHKPNNEKEKKRIIENGGKIYQTQTFVPNLANNSSKQILLGPFRVFPGRLSCSRTIGDIEAKKTEFGGNPNVIIPKPNIYIFDLSKEDIDFFIMGCDGIYDQLTNKEILDAAWQVFKNKNNENENINLHDQCGKITDFILKCAMVRKSFDNITCLIVCFKDICSNENNDTMNSISYNCFNKKLTNLSSLDNINIPINKIFIKNNKLKNNYQTYEANLPKMEKIDSFVKGENAIFNKIQKYKSANKAKNRGTQYITEATLNFKKLYNSRNDEIYKNSSIDISNRNNTYNKNNISNTSNINSMSSIENNKYKSVNNNYILNLMSKKGKINNSLANLKKRIPKCFNHSNIFIARPNNEKSRKISHNKTSIAYNLEFGNQSKNCSKYLNPNVSDNINKNSNNYLSKNFENVNRSMNINNKLTQLKNNNNGNILHGIKRIIKSKTMYRNGNNANRRRNNKYNTQERINILVKNYTEVNTNLNNLVINSINSPKKITNKTIIGNRSKKLEKKNYNKKGNGY